MLSISGIFAVTFSVVFAYVADITTEEDRGQAYGLVSKGSM
jgi:predicted MFS family arabinose efflux permease